MVNTVFNTAHVFACDVKVIGYRRDDERDDDVGSKFLDSNVGNDGMRTFGGVLDLAQPTVRAELRETSRNVGKVKFDDEGTVDQVVEVAGEVRC